MLEELAGGAGRGAGDGVAEAGLDLAAIELLPAPLAGQFHPLALHGLHAGEGFHQMALDPSIGLGLLAQLPANDRCHPHGQGDKEGQNGEGPEGQLHRIEQHHADVDHREDRIQQHRQGGAGEEAANLLQLGDAAADFTHRPLREIPQGQPQQVVNNRRPKRDVDPVGGVREEIGAQGAHQGLG